jgi:hypothetical protein
MAAHWERYLERWTSAGLIDASAAARVRAYEAGQGPPWTIQLGVKKGDGLVVPLEIS